MKEKSHVDDIDRSVYDIRDEEHDAYRIEAGLTPEIVDKISKEKNDPEWMHEFRLKSLEIYNGNPSRSENTCFWLSPARALSKWATALSHSTTPNPRILRLTNYSRLNPVKWSESYE